MLAEVLTETLAVIPTVAVMLVVMLKMVQAGRGDGAGSKMHRELQFASYGVENYIRRAGLRYSRPPGRITTRDL